MKITGGHPHAAACASRPATKTDIKTVEDLKGKRIGVPTHMGSPPFLFASRVLAANGIDPPRRTSSGCRVAPDVLGLALDSGQVDAVATSEPIGTILIGKGKVRTLADQAVDAPYRTSTAAPRSSAASSRGRTRRRRRR